MTVDELLTTTRSVRKRLDFERAVPPEVIEECLELAIQAPTGSNLQSWFFMVLTDPEAKRVVADAYRRAFQTYATTIVPSFPGFGPEDPRSQQKDAVTKSAVYLAENMAKAPVLVIPCFQGRPDKQPVFVQAAMWGSILPAAWSFMLALRSRGLGTAWTTLHLMHEAEVAKALGIPDDVTQAALLPVAYYTGTTFQPAKRVPARKATFWNHWGVSR